MIAISFLFSSLSSKFPDILYCLIQTEKRQSKPAASEKTEIQPISREFLLLKNEAQSSKDGTKSYFTIPYITISRHAHFERHKEVLPLFRFPAVSEVSSLLSQSPRLPLTLCCQPRVPTIPFHSIFFRRSRVEARMVVKGMIFPFQRIEGKEFPDPPKARVSGTLST